MDKVAYIFSQVLNISESQVIDTLSYNSFELWDSIRHMKIVALLEEEYNVEFEMQDIIDMESVGKIREILSKYASVKNKL